MMRFKEIVIVLIMMLTAPFGSAFAADIWKVPITVDDGAEKTKLYVGACKSCSDGFDVLEDANAYFGGAMKAYFFHPEWGRSRITGASDYFWFDIRSHNYPQSWKFYVADPRVGGNIGMTWDLSQVKAMRCDGEVSLSLIDDLTGQSVLLEEGGAYLYANTSTAARTFTVNADFTPRPQLSAPQVDTNPGKGAVVLRWNITEGAVGYKVYRGTSVNNLTLISGSGLLIDDDGDGEITYVDNTLSKGRKDPQTGYIYAVEGIDNEDCRSPRGLAEVQR